MNHDAEPDIVEVILLACKAEGLDPEAAHRIERTMRDSYGGQRVRIPKKKKHLTPEQRAAMIRDGMSNMSTEEVTEKWKIDRATLYRALKRGP